MYSIALYEEGRFCTQVGGPVGTLPEAIKQIKSISKPLDATELEDYFGVKFDRNGTMCALVVRDQFCFPILQKYPED
jgi:hypothetical protein